MPILSKPESLLSLTAVAANLATASAMCYIVYRLKKDQEAPQDHSAFPSFEKAASLPDEFEWDRQVTPAPELAENAFFEQDKKLGRATQVTFRSRIDGEDLVIKDTPEALTAMKTVFKRLCTSKAEKVSVKDIEKVHHLLGEPLSEQDEAEMIAFFGVQSSTETAVSFEMFMRWWSQLHDSSADPDEYYSHERYRQRFKVLTSRLSNPKIASIITVTEGEITSRRYRVHFEVEGRRISPWHDISLKNPDGSYNFICEIPKWTRKKFEIATGEPMNPIKQDVKNGVLREYKWGDMLFNYGAFPQTWEDPQVISEETGCPGDNDPIDVIELGTRQRPVGSITAVQIIGVIAMVDSDETDWKILAIALDDDKAKHIRDLNDLDAHMPGVTASLTNWLKMYKTADGKPENRFGCGGKPQGAAFATKIVHETHEAWRELVRERSMRGPMSPGGMKKVASGTDLTV